MIFFYVLYFFKKISFFLVKTQYFIREKNMKIFRKKIFPFKMTNILPHDICK